MLKSGGCRIISPLTVCLEASPRMCNAVRGVEVMNSGQSTLVVGIGGTIGIPLVASWVITYKFKIYIQIQKFTLPKFGFEDIILKIRHLNIKIENIKITSSLLSQDEKKLIAIKLHDVRIEKEVHEYKVEKSSSDNLSGGISDLLSNAEVESLRIKVPPSIVSLAQFFSVHTTNLSIMYVQDKWRECLLHVSADEVLLEGATRNDTNIALNGTIKGAHIRVLQQQEMSPQKHSEKMVPPNPSLIECNVSVKFYFELQTEIWAEMDTVSFHVFSPDLSIQERLFQFLEANDRKKIAKSIEEKSQINASVLLKRIWYFLPLKQRFRCDDLNVKILHGLGRCTAQGSLETVDFQTHFNREGALENFPMLLPDISAELLLDDFHAEGFYESFLNFSQVNMQSQFVGDRVNMKTELRSISGLYDPKDFDACYKYLSRKPKRSTKTVASKEKPIFNYCVGVIFQIWDVDLKICVPKVAANDASDCHLTFQHFRLSLALSQGASQLAGELIVESLILDLLGHGSVSDRPIKKVHNFGSILSAGLCFLQINSLNPPSADALLPLHFDALIENVQVEWSIKLTQFVECVLKYISQLKRIMPSSSDSSAGRNARTCSAKGKCTAVDIFCHTSQNVSIMARLDTLECLKNSTTAKMSISGVKSVRFRPESTTYPCLKSEDIKDAWISIEGLLIEYVNSEFLVSLSQHCSLDWSTTLHMTLLTVIEDMKRFNQKKDVSQKQSKAFDLRLQVMAEGTIRVGAVLSDQHRVDFISENLIYLMANQRVSLQTDVLKILFDDKEVFHFKDSKLVKVLQSVEIKEERESFPELDLKQNVAWKLKVDTWKITFPYKYNFAEAFSGDFISIIKWLKLVRQKMPPKEPPLPPDIVIRVKTFIAEIEDDPFEVKLRYNYELMEDEYQESCKRLEALEKKIEETRKTNLQLLSGKIDGLYKALADLNSETYIKRSKKMYNSEPIRTQLFLWKMEDVLIYALADTTFHGPDNVKSHMKNIDCESPWPEEEPQFSTLWCRMISASCGSWMFQLRDFPQSLWDMKGAEIWGRLIGAEQKPLNRSKREVTIEIGDPWDNVDIERSLTTLKFYHDFTWEASSWEVAYGPCWEPSMAQFNIAMNHINRPSRDPSLPLPWWDKARILLHGTLNMQIDKMTLLLHASLDPYNTTEEMELTWNDLSINWTNANMIFTGDLNVYVRTASKYDDARLLHMPNLKISAKICWICQGNPNDHHALIPCAPNKLPEYSSNQEHDTYRVFRSQNLKLNLSLETKHKKNELEPLPIQMLFYGSTLRWFENLKFILSGVSRPTRRGRLFNNTLPRKPQLSRHYESVHLAISFQRVDIRYWMSVRVKKGLHMSAERLSLSSEHLLRLIKVDDGLIHRPRTNWTTGFLNTELCQVQIWLQNVLNAASEEDNVSISSMATSASEGLSTTAPVEKFYFLHLTKVAYVREMQEPLFPLSESTDHTHRETPNHRLVVHNLKGVWTTSTRDIAFALYDSWDKNQKMKQNLSPDSIKNLNHNNTMVTPQKPRTWGLDTPMSPTSNVLQVNNGLQNTPSPRTRLQSDHASTMLQQLVAEADNHFVVYANDCSTPEPRDQNLQRPKTVCSTDDVLCKPWLIELENSQVLLKGCDTQGYVIISAAHSQISQRIHRPTWKGHSLVTKNSWSGSLECMQYYATVSEGLENAQMDNIMWLTVDNIEEKDGTVITEVPDIVGSGQSVGGVVSQTVGASDPENEQLQRIVSRCRCEFFYVIYGETGLEASLLDEVQPPPSTEDGLWSSPTETADSFTLRHYDLCACTNSLQYNMVLDILNNLLLYADPKKKEERAALARMRFKLQLYSSEDQRKPLVSLQNKLRFHLSQLRFLEKEIYLLQRQMEPTHKIIAQRATLEAQVGECKEKVTSLSEELAMRIHLYNETQLTCNRKLTASKGIKKEKSLIRMNEVYFRKAQWRLTEPDGQLAIAQLDLSNFLYSKKTFSDDITEHLLELGFINMSNLLPNQVYTNVLAPEEVRNSMPVDRQKTLRIYCREKPPCGGISIIEHLEINVVPLKIGLTKQFMQRMMKFCFPYNQTDDDDIPSGSKSRGEKISTITKQKKGASFYVALQKDEVEIMKQRAEQNKLFVYIKITEVPVDFSYKGKRNIQDVENYPLLIRTIEYHSVTWTWLDLLMAIKQSSKSLITQAISYKLNFHKLRHDESSLESEEEKRKLLLGPKALSQEKPVGRKTLFKLSK